MSSSATGVGMPICFLGAILLILTQKSSQKFGDVLGIMRLMLGNYKILLCTFISTNILSSLASLKPCLKDTLATSEKNGSKNIS